MVVQKVLYTIIAIYFAYLLLNYPLVENIKLDNCTIVKEVDPNIYEIIPNENNYSFSITNDCGIILNFEVFSFYFCHHLSIPLVPLTVKMLKQLKPLLKI